MATYPWAFETPGGGEIQLLKYEEHLGALKGLQIVRHDPWAPDLRRTDVVHFFSCMGGSVHFCRYVTAMNIPLVISASLWITEATRKLYPVDEIRAQLSCADLVVTNGDVESEQIAAMIGGLDRDKFVTVRNGCDEGFFTPVDANLFRERFGIARPFLLNVANIEPRKNQLALIEVARQIGIDVVNIGHVRDAAYAQQCQASGGNTWLPVGAIDHESPLLKSALAACEVFCLPSHLETPGLAAIEAAASGAKLVVTAEGSTREYFGEHAFYVNPLDQENILNQVRHALNSARSPALQNAVRPFSWANAVEPLAHAYARLARTAN